MGNLYFRKCLGRYAVFGVSEYGHMLFEFSVKFVACYKL